ncbi:MAG: DUF938 domain-containing protein [Pseudomonadota bacterium]
MHKPFSPACERNRAPILSLLQKRFAHARCALEIGSGTGQHAVHFAAALPALCWQTSELAANLPGIRAWLDEAGLPNTPPPLELDVQRPLPSGPWDAVFTANTLHIMGWPEVQQLFAGLPSVLAPEAVVTVYGPFKYGGAHTSPSNAGFDWSLRADDPRRGIRDLDAVDLLARAAGLTLIEDAEMPANNRCVSWQRTPS